MLLGADALKKLAGSRVAVFGVGGVGGYVVEALARSGVGSIDLIDDDQVVLSNLNRQIIATMDTIGRNKVDVMAERILSINPEAVVYRHKCFYLPETAPQFDFSAYDYVVDAIDTVTGKIQLILQAKEAGVPVISAMGAGNKLDPSRFEVADIYCDAARIEETRSDFPEGRLFKGKTPAAYAGSGFRFVFRSGFISGSGRHGGRGRGHRASAPVNSGESRLCSFCGRIDHCR